MAVALSAGVRTNLLSLQSTASMLTQTQEKLSTGKKVNSALDNPTNFFTAQALTERATSLTSLQDGINTGVQTVKAANKGLDTISTLLKQAKSIAEQAKNGSATSARGMTSDAALTLSTTGDGGTAVTAASGIKNKTAASNLVDAAGLATGDTITFSATKNGVVSSFEYTVTGVVAGANRESVQTFLDAVNSSGVGTAKIEDNGTISFSSTNATAFDVTIESAGATGGAANDTKVLFGQSLAEAATANTFVFASGATTSAAGNGQDYTSQYADVLQAINDAAGDASYNGINLLAGGDSNKLSVMFDAASKSKIDVDSKEFDTTALALTPTLNATTAEAAIANIESALNTVKGTQGEYGNKLAIMQTRLDFSKELSNMLEVGADNLTLADTNKEAANLLALQTRQSLSQSALSLANQADQAVLQLLR